MSHFMSCCITRARDVCCVHAWIMAWVSQVSHVCCMTCKCCSMLAHKVCCVTCVVCCVTWHDMQVHIRCCTMLSYMYATCMSYSGKRVVCHTCAPSAYQVHTHVVLHACNMYLSDMTWHDMTWLMTAHKVHVHNLQVYILRETFIQSSKVIQLRSDVTNVHLLTFKMYTQSLTTCSNTERTRQTCDLQDLPTRNTTHFKTQMAKNPEHLDVTLYVMLHVAQVCYGTYMGPVWGWRHIACILQHDGAQSAYTCC